MKIRQKILNFIFIMAMMFSTLVFTGVGAFAMEPQSKQKLHLQSRLGFLTQQRKADGALLAALPQQPLNTPSKAQPPVIPKKNTYTADNAPEIGFKHAFLKFLLAMLGVLVSSLAIFAGLKLYKKIVLKSDIRQGEIDYDKTLESPKNFKEAINLFLHKTRK